VPRFAIVLAAVALTFASACGSKGKQKRAGDAAPVEIVQQPTGDAGAGSGASADEVEPNDGEDVATPLPLGTMLRGKIEPDTDADFYRIEVKEAGALAIELSAPDGVDLTLEILDGGGTSVARSDRGGVRVREGVPNLGVTPGRYTAVVRAKKLPPVPVKKPAPAPKKGKKAPPAEPPEITLAPTYELTAHVTAPAGNAEREPDDDRGTAIDLIVGDTATGYLGWSGDADVWKLSVETLSEKNSIDVEISAVEGVALTLELADGVCHPLLARKAPRGAPLVVRGLIPVVPPGAPPFHYLTLKGDRSNPETAYQLRVSAKLPVTDAEIEPNDTPDQAMPVPADRTVVHATWTPGDLDNFALPVDQAGRTVEITIDPPGDADLSAELLVAGKPVGKGERPGKGAQEKFSGVVPAGATAILRVHGSDSSLEGAYDVTIQDGPAAP
jgi:hypothetical protein